MGLGPGESGRGEFNAAIANGIAAHMRVSRGLSFEQVRRVTFANHREGRDEVPIGAAFLADRDGGAVFFEVDSLVEALDVRSGDGMQGDIANAGLERGQTPGKRDLDPDALGGKETRGLAAEHARQGRLERPWLPAKQVLARRKLGQHIGLTGVESWRQRGHVVKRRLIGGGGALGRHQPIQLA